MSLYGAVTIGEAWRFGKLDRCDRKISQDLNLYKVPDELEQLLSILVGIVKGNEVPSKKTKSHNA